VTRSSSMKFALSAVVLVSMVSGLASRPALAATATTTFGVNATVQATCLVSATAMAFGTYTGAVATSTSAVSVTCTNTTPYNVGLSAGLATGATVTTRSMTGPAAALLRPGHHRIRTGCRVSVCRAGRIRGYDHRHRHVLTDGPHNGQSRQ
jgi:spore coat protein U-like protein